MRKITSTISKNIVLEIVKILFSQAKNFLHRFCIICSIEIVLTVKVRTINRLKLFSVSTNLLIYLVVITSYS